MGDFLDIITQNVKRTVESGYYQVESTTHKGGSLKENILKCKGNPIISEIKLSSPTRNLVEGEVDVVEIASAMKSGGVIGISVLTEPKHFKGSLGNFKLIRENTSLPLLMKDFFIRQIQVDTAHKIGADAILLIQTLFDRDYCDIELEEMIEYAHSYNLEVLLETHTEFEFQRALNSNADIIGINNRDLKTLTIDIQTTEKILKKHDPINHIVVSESGVESPAHIHFLKYAGAKAFLVGTAILTSKNYEDKARELVEA
jgi:indole-3-glycerol phosphate synthase